MKLVSKYLNRNVTWLDISTAIIVLVIIANILTYLGIDPLSVHGVDPYACSPKKINLLTSIR